MGQDIEGEREKVSNREIDRQTKRGKRGREKNKERKMGRHK